nr:protein piccolo-like [Dermacentor andersoni]
MRGSGLAQGTVSESGCRLPRGHRSENFGNAESDFFGHWTPPLPPATKDDAATVATAAVDAASQKPDLSFQSSTSATLTQAPTPPVPVVESSELDVAPANKGQVSSSSTMTFDSRSSAQRPVTTKLVKVTSSRVRTLSPRGPELYSQTHTPAAVTDTETLVTTCIEEFRPGIQAKPASSAAAYLTPPITDTRTSDRKPVPPEPDRVGSPNLERHADGPTSDQVTTVDEKPQSCAGKDAHGQVYNNFGQRIVEVNCLTPAPGLSEVTPAKKAGKDAECGKKGRQKTRSGNNKITGTKKGKRSAKRSADSTSSKSSCGESTRSKGGTPISDQPPEAAEGSPNEKTELRHVTEGLNAASRSALEGDRHQETIAFEAIPFLKECRESSAATSHPAVPPNAGQLNGAEGAHDTRRTSADDEQARKTSSSGQPQSSEPEVNATAAASESKREREQDDGANVKEPSKKSRTSKPSTKRAGRSSDQNKAGKDRADRETKPTTKLGSGLVVCPESVAN